MYKNQLQELAQRSCFNLPSYSCIREGPDHAPRFKAKVNFNGEIFESPQFYSNLRQAEHAAAEVALKAFSEQGPSKALAARVLDETGIYKNLLQETAHRAGLKLPVYTTTRVGAAYTPVFTCTVELGGMTFAGEPLKTKKQAQKSAAIAAWTALKKLAEQGKSTLLESNVRAKDEQDQVVVARYLSNLKQSDTKKVERDHSHVQKERLPIRRGTTRYHGGKHFHQNQQQSSFSHFLPKMPAYPTWNQELYSQQSHLLAFPSASTCNPSLQFFPVAPSVVRPDMSSYFFTGGQTHNSHVPELRRVFYFSNDILPVPVRSTSQVMIEENRERKENTVGEEEKLNSDSSLSVIPTDVHRGSGCVDNGSSLKIEVRNKEENELKKSESASDNRKCDQQHTSASEKLSWAPPGFVNGTMVTPSKETKQHPQSSHGSASLSPNVAASYETVASSSRPIRPLSHTQYTPLRGKAIETSFGTSFFAESSNVLAPISPPRGIVVYPCPSRPKFEGIRNNRDLSCGTSMAPAVQIRSVVPVCSAPLARRNPSTSLDGTSSRDKKKEPEETENDIATTSSEFCNLEI